MKNLLIPVKMPDILTIDEEKYKGEPLLNAE